MSKYCFISLSTEPWQYHDRKKAEVGTMPYSYQMTSRFSIVHMTIDSTVHSRPLNSLE